MRFSDILKDFEAGKLNIEGFRAEIKKEAMKLDVGSSDLVGKEAKGSLPTEPERMGDIAVCGRYLQTVARAGNPRSPHFQQANDELEKQFGVEKAMSEGTGTAGGHLVPEHLARELYGFFEGESMTARYLTEVDMMTDKKYLPLSDGKVSVTINSEEDAIEETTPTLDRATLETYRMDAYTKVSNELLEDSDLSIQTILLDQFNEQSAMLFDDVVFNGDGSAGSAGFSGVFSAAAGYSEVFDAGSTAFSEVTLSNMIDLAHLIPSYVRKQGQVFMHSDVMKYLRKEQDDSGQYLMPPYTFALQGALGMRSGPPSTPKLLGAYPMLESHKCPSTSGADTAFIAFGNFKYIAHGLRHNRTSLLTDPYTSAANWQTRLIYVRRFALAYIKTGAFARMVTGSAT